jgi:ribonuclease BN (tRNA processing enzyme)
VEEIDDCAKVTVGHIAVTAASNSHYSLEEDRADTERALSLSYRFDLPERSILFTGDTGPSSNVEHLAHGVDLLVSEIMDVDTALADLRRTRPDVSPAALEFVRQHFIHEHLTADQVGILAQHAEARSLVLTHFGGATGGQAQIDRLTKVIGSHFRGPITFARDLDRF